MKHILFALSLLITLTPLWGQVPPAVREKIAHLEGVPVKVLESIWYVESGHHPWSVQANGTSHLFDTKAQAERFIDRMLAQGQTSFDVGCAQVNWHWHGKHFKSAKDLLVPETCLRYAAQLLKANYRRTGSWMRSALLYHSGLKSHQQIYRQKLIRYLKGRS